MDTGSNYLMYSLMEMYSPALVGLSMILSVLYIFPGMQALYAYNKKKWLEKQFAATASSGEAENKFRKTLLEAAEPGQSHPIYKIFKFYFATVGIVTMIVGFLMIVIPENPGPDAIDGLLFIPAIVGGILFFVYKMYFVGHGIYREIAAVLAFVGGTITAVAAYENFEMNSWLRADILAFVILGLGAYIIWDLKSTLVSYLYMIAVAFAGALVYEELEDNWLSFLPHLLWLFGIAILYVWIPKLRNAKDIGPKEILFGIFFTAMILTLTWTQLSRESGLLMPALAIVIPGLYVFSKAYFYKAENLIGRPIEYIIISIVIVMAALLSTEIFMTAASDSIYLFKQYSFEKQVSYFIILGLIAGIFWIFDNDFKDPSIDVNPLIVAFPLLAFVIAYILGEYGGHYIMTLFLLGLGYFYVRKGIEMKDAIRIGLGTVIFIYTLILKSMDMWQEYLFDGKYMSGLTVMLFGALFLGSILYIRSKWTVTGPSEVSKPIDNQVLDSLDDAASSNIHTTE